MTDKEIITALECMTTSDSGTSGYTVNIAPYALDLIRRLQSENERLMERVFDCTAVIEYNEKCSKEIQAATILLEQRNKEIAEQMTEIERLMEETSDFRQEVITLNIEKLELQKQVDKLKEQSLLKCDQCPARQDLGLLLYQQEQAVKDTAIRCYDKMLEECPIIADEEHEFLRFTKHYKNWLKEEFGVEVE